ncbi:PREDICTED: uncharacterized protein LOC108759778 isoform X2 [Trachymyrmex cornetzi]|uniref:Uncharacterized protein n=2 Tax=Trachymyrmex cornetzi TaxID=471704 RepID=A0A195E9S0_9HYME|nr:PREDICTED: uncharacterized protein LOC108759778 isoform X2 [Trachymyrmex cornetzi]KYN21527.1 hypothetical protein ALC57_06141 [Trachymyrmex cornetzi]
MNELCIQDVSSSRPSLQDKSAILNLNTHIGESSSGSITVVTSSLITANGNESNDDPPPYAAITPSNHIGWPYGLFPFNNSHFTDGTHRMEIPLTPFQTRLTPVTDFHPEGINDRYESYPMSLTTPYQFLKFGYYRNSLWRETVDIAADDEITDKFYDKKPRTCGVILVAAAVIIFLMALSLIVRFVMEKSWGQR